MTNVLSETKRQQVVALGRLGWPLRRIENATGVRRETASAYLKAAGLPVRVPGGWGRRPIPQPAEKVSTDPEDTVTAKPANEVSTDSGPPAWLPRPGRSPQASACEPYREVIVEALGRGRNAVAIWQDLVSQHGFTKTRIVYCKDDDRPGQYEHVRFDFLGYTFQPRRAKNRWGKYFVSFFPAISTKAAKAIRKTIRAWRMASTRNNQSLEDLARLTNPAVRGWMQYSGRYYRSRCLQVLRHLNEALAAWVRRKYTRLRRRERESMYWLGRIARRDPNLFVLWQLGLRSEVGG